MSSWALIIFVYAGVLSNNDSVALTSVTFQTESTCEAAGEKAKELTDGTMKNTHWICVKQ